MFTVTGKTYSHQEMPYFNREFPVLGGGGSGERMPPHMEEKDHPQYGPKQPVMRNTRKCLLSILLNKCMSVGKKYYLRFRAFGAIAVHC